MLLKCYIILYRIEGNDHRKCATCFSARYLQYSNQTKCEAGYRL